MSRNFRNHFSYPDGKTKAHISFTPKRPLSLAMKQFYRTSGRSSILAGIILLSVLIFTGPGLASAQQNTPIVIKDITGNIIELDKPAERVLLGEGRHLIALSLVHSRPADVIAGWLGDMRRLGGATYELYLSHFPELDDIPMVGVTSEETFSVEKALAVQPDVAIFSGGGHGPSPSSSEVIR